MGMWTKGDGYMPFLIRAMEISPGKLNVRYATSVTPGARLAAYAVLKNNLRVSTCVP